MVNNGRSQKVSEMLRRRGEAPAQSRSRPAHVRRVSGAWEGRGGGGEGRQGDSELLTWKVIWTSVAPCTKFA